MNGSKSDNGVIIAFASLALCIFSIFLCWQHFAWQNVTSTWVWNPGAFGDTFGVLTSFLSLLALIGIFATYRKESRQLSILLSERKNAELDSIRTELFDTYKIMIETKRMIIDINHINIENRRESAKGAGFWSPAMNKNEYEAATILSLYEVQNAWLLNALSIIKSYPLLATYLRYYIGILVASLDKKELRAMMMIIASVDLTFLGCILATVPNRELSQNVDEYLGTLSEVESEDYHYRIAQANETLQVLFRKTR